MTSSNTSPPEPRHDDELLSAYFDGELEGSEQRALEERLAREAALRDRLEQLGAAAPLVAAMALPSEVERAEVLARVHDALHGDARVHTTAPVGHRTRRADRAGTGERSAWWSLAAGLLIVAGLAGGIRLAATGSSTDDGGDAATSATVAENLNVEGADAAAAATTAASAGRGIEESLSGSFDGAGPIELGAQADVAAAIDAARLFENQSGGLSSVAPTAATGSNETAGAWVDGLPPACPGAAPLARATVGDRLVVVTVELGTGGEDELVVRDAVTCTELGRDVRRG